ncbi:TPA: TraR/DksA family transcriptional regulator [Vibrio campbellii]
MIGTTKTQDTKFKAKPLNIIELQGMIPQFKKEDIEKLNTINQQIIDRTRERSECRDESDKSAIDTDIALLQSRSKKIAEQLKRYDAVEIAIKNKHFGHCNECAEPIDILRLNLEPTTTTCMTCKSHRAYRDRVQFAHH